MSKSDNIDLQEFSFDLVGNGFNVFAGTFKATDLERALNEARKYVQQKLPGYSLVCRETGDSFPAVKFFDRRDTRPGGRPTAKYL